MADTIIDLEGPSTAARTGKYDDLLCTPAPMDTNGEADAIDRVSLPYEDKGQRFVLAGSRSFQRQYAQLYFCRLAQLAPAVRARAEARWPGVPVVKTLGVREDEDAVVVGTLFKQQRLRTNVLDEYTKDGALKQALGLTNFCDASDSLVLEDEGARLVLRGATEGALPVGTLVTGAIVAVRGRADAGGDFLVSDVCFAGLPPQPPRPVFERDVYVAFVSGLALASTQADRLRAQLLVDFLTGNLAGRDQQAGLVANIARLFVLGSTLGQLEALAGGGGGGGALSGSGSFGRQQGAGAGGSGAAAAASKAVLEPVADMDMLVTELAAGLPVNVLPGADDPTNVSLPQQPLHACLFPGAAPYSSFVRATNPHDCEVGGVRLVASGGQNIDDMAKYSTGADRLDLMESTLQWRHLAPTAPDTLTCYPFASDDPFVLPECPHVYAAGNQPEFGTRLVQGPNGQSVRLVAVPQFSTTGSIVLLNLRTMQCQLMSFGAYRGSGAQ